MSRWGKKTRILIDVDAGGLDAAVNQARQDWQHARHLVEISEPDGGLDDAIYYLQLTEKRYMFLLSQAKREHHRKQA